MNDVWLVYDDECPVCRTYCRRVRIEQSVGRLHLVDARQPGPLMDEITAAGLDIDQGMVLKLGQARYYGADAMHMLTLISTRTGWFNRLCFLFFGSRPGAHVFYPLGKAFRNLVLKLLGIGYIDNLKPTPEQWFGDEFGKLDPLLQQLHRQGGSLRGAVAIRYGEGLGGRLGEMLARRLGLPAPAPHNRLEVRIAAGADGLHWDRCFNGATTFNSLFVPAGRWPTGLWIERSGALRLGLRVEVIDGAWHWRPAKVWLHGVRIPLWLLPRTAASKEVLADRRYRFRVSFSLPLFGTVLSYGGELAPIGPA